MMARLGDVCNIRGGYAFKSEKFSNKGIPIIRIGNITDNGIKIDNNVCFNETFWNENENYRVNKNDILVAMSGATVGKSCINNQSDKLLLNQRVAAISSNEKVKNEYIYYFISSPAFMNYVLNQSVGCAQPNISIKQLSDIELYLPELKEQNVIVQKLCKIDLLINDRNKQLSKLDELVKSRFIEMFGDPVVNPMNWETSLLKNVTSKIGSGATPKGGKESYQNEGVTLIRSMNVHDGRFEYKDLAYITDEQAKQLDNVIIEENDVFINITGASVARSCIVPKHILPARVNQHVAIIRCIPSILNPVFANNMFLNISFKGQLLDIGESGGATRQAITKQQLEILDVILPPIDLQNEFAVFAEQIGKLKSEIKESLEKLDTLKKSLMQKYFG